MIQWKPFHDITRKYRLPAYVDHILIIVADILGDAFPIFKGRILA